MIRRLRFRTIGIALALAASAVSLFAGVALAASQSTGVVDPSTFDLSILLTAGGIPIASAIISSLIELAKRLPGVEGRESVISMILDAILIAYAFVAVGAPLTLVSAFLTFMAWLNLAGTTSAFYDKVLKPSGLNKALNGGNVPNTDRNRDGK